MMQTWKEVNIPVPYGQISCKTWGEQREDNERNFVAIHGWQDNAATFDTLIPLFDFDAFVVAVDLPGHGLSSHLPNGVLYSDFNYIIDIKRVAAYFGWKKFSFIGHSLGGMIALYFASLYPDEVETVVCLDVLKPLTCKIEESAESVAKNLNAFFNVEKKVIASKPPKYSYSDAINRLLEAHSQFGNIGVEGAKILLTRGARKTGENSYEFNRDIRLRSLMFTRLTEDCLIAYFSRLKCNVLIILAEKGVKHDKDEVKRKFVSVYKKFAKHFKLIEIEGEHHIHLYDPKAVVSHINDFVVELMCVQNGHNSA